MASDAPSGNHADAERAVGEVLGTFLDMVDEQLPGFVEGLYVVGSFALGDWTSHSDIDVVVATTEAATDDDAATLRAVHALLAERHPRPFVDGPYVAWSDLLVEPATGLHRPWSLDGELHHDGDCFEINPVTWYTLATYGRTARGPRPDRLDIAVDTEAMIRFVVGNLDTYWAGVADEVRATCASDPAAGFAGDALEWCALGALRLHYTAFTADVTSKRGAGEYGLGILPAELHSTIDAALAVRAGQHEGPVAVASMQQAADIIDWVVADVRASAAHLLPGR